MKAVLRSYGSLKQAADTIDLAYKIGTDFLLTAEHSLPWYKNRLWDIYAVYCTILVLFALLVRACWAGAVSIWISLKNDLK